MAHETRTSAKVAATEIASEQVGRQREEVRMLLLGFGTGLLIGVFFLTYIVIAVTQH